MPLSDEELIKEILNGSQAAMEVLVKRHYNMVFSFVYRKIGNYHTALDIVQEIFIKMIKSLKSYRHTGKFQNWLLTIAVNHCRDYYRSSLFLEQTKEKEISISLPDKNENVWDLFIKKKEKEEIQKLILTLPDYQRDVIILKYYHEKKIKEIAQIMGSKEATVKSRLRQGLMKLKELIIGGEFFEKRNKRL